MELGFSKCEPPNLLLESRQRVHAPCAWGGKFNTVLVKTCPLLSCYPLRCQKTSYSPPKEELVNAANVLLEQRAAATAVHPQMENFQQGKPKVIPKLSKTLASFSNTLFYWRACDGDRRERRKKRLHPGTGQFLHSQVFQGPIKEKGKNAFVYLGSPLLGRRLKMKCLEL